MRLGSYPLLSSFAAAGAWSPTARKALLSTATSSSSPLLRAAASTTPAPPRWSPPCASYNSRLTCYYGKYGLECPPPCPTTASSGELPHRYHRPCPVTTPLPRWPVDGGTSAVAMEGMMVAEGGASWKAEGEAPSRCLVGDLVQRCIGAPGRRCGGGPGRLVSRGWTWPATLQINESHFFS